MTAPQPNPGRKSPGALNAMVKVEKLTEIAFTLPVGAALGGGLGWVLDKVVHTHWIYIVGLVLGVIAGFVQLFRTVSSATWTAASAPDPDAPKGPGFRDTEGDR